MFLIVQLVSEKLMCRDAHFTWNCWRGRVGCCQYIYSYADGFLWYQKFTVSFLLHRRWTSVGCLAFVLPVKIASSHSKWKDHTILLAVADSLLLLTSNIAFVSVLNKWWTLFSLLWSSQWSQCGGKETNLSKEYWPYNTETRIADGPNLRPPATWKISSAESPRIFC